TGTAPRPPPAPAQRARSPAAPKPRRSPGAQPRSPTQWSPARASGARGAPASAIKPEQRHEPECARHPGMPFVADLHVHPKYSRATSRDLDLEHLARWAQLKGITVVGTGDFTHPAWFAELKEKLVPAEDGLFRLRDDIAAAVEREVPAACRRPVRFLLQVEISNIYK